MAFSGLFQPTRIQEPISTLTAKQPSQPPEPRLVAQAQQRDERHQRRQQGLPASGEQAARAARKPKQFRTTAEILHTSHVEEEDTIGPELPGAFDLPGRRASASTPTVEPVSAAPVFSSGPHRSLGSLFPEFPEVPETPTRQAGTRAPTVPPGETDGGGRPLEGEPEVEVAGAAPGPPPVQTQVGDDRGPTGNGEGDGDGDADSVGPSRPGGGGGGPPPTLPEVAGGLPVGQAVAGANRMPLDEIDRTIPTMLKSLMSAFSNIASALLLSPQG
ncbi:hypothetical protein VNI00_017708 [Paramarasmius palmivorus]|uniref:Uncharacterized protein n=1 Tax=Paramarasmius palmivorus TaxID=297713 RepID=A0AAW0B3J5_9AGAR